MCGRFASARKRTELLAEFEVQRDRTEEPLQPDYNVAPTKRIYAVVVRKPQDGDGASPEASGAAGESARTEDARPEAGGRTAAGGGTGADGGPAVRELRVVRWGLVPSWAKDISIGSRMINARAETVATKPAFRKAFARHRCLIPADGFYEWVKDRNRKQPYFIHRADGGLLAFAGLYERWRDRSLPEDDPGAWRWTATIITTTAPDEIGRIHDRMPMVIEPARWADWLDPAATGADGVHALMAPAASAHLASYPVATLVNSVRNNGPQLIEPLAGAGERAEAGLADSPPPQAGNGRDGSATLS